MLKFLLSFLFWFIFFNLNIILIFVDLVSTDVTGDMQYWFEYPQQKRVFIESIEAIQKWPQLLRAFLESGLTFVDSSLFSPTETGFIGIQMGKP